MSSEELLLCYACAVRSGTFDEQFIPYPRSPRANEAVVHYKEQQNNTVLRTHSCFCAPFEFFLNNNLQMLTLNIHPSGFSYSFLGFPSFLYYLMSLFSRSLVPHERGASRLFSKSNANLNESFVKQL